jgi:hypothetical protein
MADYADRAERFKALHEQERPLVPVNAGTWARRDCSLRSAPVSGCPSGARCENTLLENNLTPEGQAWPLIC